MRRLVYCTASFSICSLRRAKFPIIYPVLWLDYKVATHPDVVEFVILRRRLDELMPVELGDEFLRFGDALLLLQPLQFAFRRNF